MREFAGKKIILGVPDHFGLPDCFKKNLEHLGFQVFLLRHDSSKRKIPAKDLIIHFFRKFFLKDKTYKAEKIAEIKAKPQLDFIKKVPKSDYALIIRPDLFAESVLLKVGEKVNFSVAYHWDGLERFPLSKKRIRLFDRFFVFDSNDAERFPNTIPTTNFYFDYLPQNFEVKQDVFFVGTYMKDRIHDLAELSDQLKNAGLKTSINVLYSKPKQIEKYRNSSINFIKQGFSFEQEMIESKSSNILLDIENKLHSGISFRCFEALGFGKKLITNNPLTKNLDFFDPQNIFILKKQSHRFSEFISRPYKNPTEELMNKYSFTNWITNALNALNFNSNE